MKKFQGFYRIFKIGFFLYINQTMKRKLGVRGQHFKLHYMDKRGSQISDKNSK